MSNELKQFGNNLYGAIRQVLETARQSAYKAVNFAMVQAYWQIGRLIVEDEQNGENRAEYGKKVLDSLAERLTADFGKGFDAQRTAADASILSAVFKMGRSASRIELDTLPPVAQS